MGCKCKSHPIQQLLSEVAEFHKVTGHTWIDKAEVPELMDMEDEKFLRIQLMKEELQETIDALCESDPVEALDGMIDLLFVTLGSIGSLGLTRFAPDTWDEVVKSNMSKPCKDIDEAQLTQKYYLKEKGTLAVIRETKSPTGKTTYTVARSEDGKALKSVRYTAVNIPKIFEKICQANLNQSSLFSPTSTITNGAENTEHQKKD